LKFIFHERPWDNCQDWIAKDRKIAAGRNTLIRKCTRTPLHGIGKPETSRGAFYGFWPYRAEPSPSIRWCSGLAIWGWKSPNAGSFIDADA
jgi:Txe/YoeB family toxin of Txe-Axe toxin-antitoxin module